MYASNVTAQASSGGKDAAVFYSYPSNTFTGAPGTSSLAGSATNVKGASVTFVSQALGFDSVSVFESGAGTDVADLTSPGSGSFFGTSTASTLTVGASTITVNTYFVSSGQTLAVPSQIIVTGNHDGTDSASIEDAPGNNALTASGSTATLTTSLGSVAINKFGSVTANQQNGTNDTVHEDTVNAIDFTPLDRRQLGRAIRSGNDRGLMNPRRWTNPRLTPASEGGGSAASPLAGLRPPARTILEVGPLFVDAAASSA